jgi:DHA1 family bicyclomycin/chloramphenicol resistance-like MFS transporter
MGAHSGRVVLILGALSAFGPVSMDTYLPGLPELSRDIGASASEAQLTLTACLFGLAAGQLLAGPASDALGRRRPLLAGLAGFTLASLLCAAAPDVWSLTAARVLQGLTGAVGIVLARAIARDLHSGDALARFFAVLMLVNGLAPILAPVAGAQLLHVTDWRGVFVALAGVGAVLLAVAAVALPETLPPERRHGGGLATTRRAFAGLLADRRFLGYVLSCGLVFAAMFAYIAGSPFVLQEIHGLSAQEFSAVFGVNAAGIMAASALSGRLVTRHGPARLLAAGLALQTAGGVGLLVCVLAGAGLAGVVGGLFVVVSSVGLVFPNAAALALGDHPERAGSASALLGLCQYLFGAAAAPLVGVAGTDTAVPMAVVIAVAAIAAATAYRTLVGSRRVPPPWVPPEPPPPSPA